MFDKCFGKLPALLLCSTVALAQPTPKGPAIVVDSLPSAGTSCGGSTAIPADVVYVVSGAPGATDAGKKMCCVSGQLAACDQGGGGGTPGGNDTEVQFKDVTVFGGDPGLTYNKTTDTLTVATEVAVPTVDVTTAEIGANTAKLTTGGPGGLFRIRDSSDVNRVSVNLGTGDTTLNTGALTTYCDPATSDCGVFFTNDTTGGDHECNGGDFWVAFINGTCRLCEDNTASDCLSGGGDVSTSDTTTTDNELVRFDGTGGTTIQGTATTPPTLSDTGVLTMNNNIIGSGNKLYYDHANGRLSVGGGAPGDRLVLNNAADGNSMSFRDAFNVAKWLWTTDNTFAGMDFSPDPANDTSSAELRFFLTTDTTGAAFVEICDAQSAGTCGTPVARLYANGTSTNDSYISVGGSGALGFGTTTPDRDVVVTIDDTLKLVPVTTAPVTCDSDEIGTMYFDDSGALCVCTAASTWSVAAGGGSCA